MKKLGHYIQSRRINIGMSQRELAEKLGVTLTTISRWENEHCEPRVYEFIKICDILGMKLKDFEEVIK